MATSNNSISGIKNIDIKYFEDKYITFRKYKEKSYKWIFNNDKSYCLWLSKNIKNPDSDKIKIFEFLNIQYKITIKEKNNDIEVFICSTEKKK